MRDGSLAVDAAFAAINGAIELIVPEVILIAIVCLAFAISPFLVNERGQAAAAHHIPL